MELEVEVDFGEGDILIINDEQYLITDIDNHTATITWKKAGLGELQHITVEEIEDSIKYTGKFTRIREEYVSIFDP